MKVVSHFLKSLRDEYMVSSVLPLNIMGTFFWEAMFYLIRIFILMEELIFMPLYLYLQLSIDDTLNYEERHCYIYSHVWFIFGYLMSLLVPKIEKYFVSNFL